VLCAPLRASEADENPAQSGNFVSSIRLKPQDTVPRDLNLKHWWTPVEMMPVRAYGAAVRTIRDGWRCSGWTSARH
jgi:hypothetical protein